MERSQFKFSDIVLEVRFSDLDASGHLNHATVLKYLEQARVRYYQDVLGMEVPRDLVAWVLAEITVSYRVPGRFGDRIQVWLRIPWMRRSSAGWEFVLTRTSDDAVIAEGKGVHVHVDTGSGRGSEIPGPWRKRIAEYEGIAATAPAAG